MKEIERMQKNLLLIRRTVGWTADEFGNRIGVSRQTINNLEAGRNKLSKTQYIAIRSILDAEIAAYPDETEMLKLILEVFVDRPEEYPDKDREALLSKANMITPSILAGSTSRRNVSKELIASAAAIGTFTAIITSMSRGLSAGSSTAAWLVKALINKEK